MDPAVTRPDELRPALAAIARRLGYQGSLAPEQRLVEDLRLDSVGMLTLAVEVEDHFKVCLDAEDEAGIRTVGDLERVLLAKLGAAVE
jgi:acyl carrier protein